MKPDDVKNRKDAMIYFLLMLNERGRQIDLGEFFFSSGYAYGIESFEGLMDEMQLKGWINIRKTPSGSVPGMPFLHTNRVSYEISLDGIEYLSSLGLIEDRFKKMENSTHIKQTHISGGQVIINEQPNSGNQSLSDNAEASPTIQATKIMTSKTKSKRPILEISAWIAAIIGTIITFITLIYYLNSI